MVVKEDGCIVKKENPKRFGVNVCACLLYR